MTDKIAIERKILEHTVIALEYAYGADDVLIAESIRFLRHALAQKAEPPSCKYCDGTGDVHSLGGQWRGRCTECNFSEPQTQKDKEQYAFEDWLASECPSGNVESVQSQWEASAEYLELQPGATEQALQKIADFGQDQERPAPSQAKSLALLDLDSVEHMQGGANGPTIRLRGFINAQTGPTAPQPPIDNAFVADGCEQFSPPAEPT